MCSVTTCSVAACRTRAALRPATRSPPSRQRPGLPHQPLALGVEAPLSHRHRSKKRCGDAGPWPWRRRRPPGEPGQGGFRLEVAQLFSGPHRPARVATRSPARRCSCPRQCAGRGDPSQNQDASRLRAGRGRTGGCPGNTAQSRGPRWAGPVCGERLDSPVALPAPPPHAGSAHACSASRVCRPRGFRPVVVLCLRENLAGVCCGR